VETNRNVKLSIGRKKPGGGGAIKHGFRRWKSKEKKKEAASHLAVERA